MRLRRNNLFADTRLSARVVNPRQVEAILKMIKAFISEDPSNYFCMYSGKTIKFDKVLFKCTMRVKN